MSSLNSSPKSKSKGFRNAFRNLFTRPASPLPSRPVSPLPPQHRVGVPPAIPIEARTPVDESQADKSGPKVSSSQRPTVAEPIPAPLMISAEPANPQPTQGDTHTSTSPKDEDTPIDTAWAGFRASLKSLEQASGVFGPLASAAGVLLECFDTIEIAAKNRQDYEELATDLKTMSDALARHFRVGGSVRMSTSMSECISSIFQSLERQAKEINGKQDRGTGRKRVLAKDDEDDVMRRYRRIQSLFRQLELNLNLNTWSMANEDSVRKRLEALDPKRQAEYDSRLSESINRRTCTEGTRKTVLSDLTNWLQDPTSPAVCWMNGMAGTGKTTIAYTLAEWLEREHLLGASFFCTRTSADCRDVGRIIPTIVYQLARHSIPFQSALCDAPVDSLEAGSKNISKQFEQLLKDPLLKTETKSPDARGRTSDCLVVVIDALDECDDQAGVEKLLEVLFRHAPDIPLKFFVTSRPEPEIYETMLQNAHCREAVYLHDVEKSLVRADIELYLTHELASMSLGPADIEELADRSGSLFIYAATLVRYIQPLNRRANPHKRLRSLLDLTAATVKGHTQIDELYIAVLRSALTQEGMEPEETEDIRLVLLTVLFAQEPIGIETIATLSDIDDPCRVEYALRSLRSVLHQSTNGLVSTLHASFADFMFDSKRSGSYCGDTVEHGHLLAMRCFVVMKEQLRFNICDLQSSFSPDTEVEGIEAIIKAKISPTLAYISRYWANHLAHALITQNLLELFADFLLERLLFWTEVMTLRHVVIMGIDVLLNAKRWLTDADTVPSNLTLWLEDAINFVTSYAANSSSMSTPHIYISALALCPRSSLVHKHYSKRVRGLLELKGSVMERRDAAPQAHWNVGSTVYAVAYSPDGTRVAAGCWDGTVSIRSAVDGKSLVGPLQGHTDAVRSVTFSPDGKLLASGSWDNTIRVWNVLTGELTAGPFEGHTSIVSSVSFSPDSKRIVSGSRDKTIRVWDATDGTVLLGPLEGHDGGVNSVSFSPDGSLIASASDDKTIRLWHSHNGSPASSPFQGHTRAVLSIVFTPDGTRLVSGSWDKTVRVWNVSDGSSVGHPFKGHTDLINSVAVSTDGTRVASSSNDCTLRVWKIRDGSLVAGPLVGDNQPILSVAFSPDGTRVIADSGSGIQVWNVREGVHAPTLSALQDAVTSIRSMKLSTDGSSIVTCSRDKTIRMWDVRVGSFTEDRDQEPFESTSISDTSPDGTYVLGPSEGGKVQIMHKADGSLAVGPFDVDHDSIRAFRFSHDNNSVIMGCRDGTIQVQPLAGGKAPVRVFFGHQEDIRSIDQYHDGSLLVSHSGWDDSMRVWNMIAPVLQLDSFPTSLPTSALDHSTSAIYDGWRVKEDGWVVNKSNQLLFWLPPDIAAIWLSPYASLIITPFGVLTIPEQKVFVGEQWWRCYVGDQSHSNDLTHTSPISSRA